MRLESWREVGGVDGAFKFAFDLDLLLKLQRPGRVVYIGPVVSSFRWHTDSLNVGDRTTSLDGSQEAKRRALSPTTRKVAWLWERPGPSRHPGRRCRVGAQGQAARTGCPSFRRHRISGLRFKGGGIRCTDLRPVGQDP